MLVTTKMFAPLGAVLGLGFLAMAALAPGNSGSIQFGHPGKSGEQKTTIVLTYDKPGGAQGKKTITVTTAVTNSTTEAQKKTLVQQALDAELAKPANQENGHALGSTSGGSGNIMTINPSADSNGNFSGVKLKSISTDDFKTGEKDKVTPANDGGSVALAEIEVVGDITGSDGSGTSYYAVETNLGTVTINLAPGMTKPALVRQLASGLTAQGATVWTDPTTSVLFVLMPGGEDGISSIGAGSTDEGLIARCTAISGS